MCCKSYSVGGGTLSVTSSIRAKVAHFICYLKGKITYTDSYAEYQPGPITGLPYCINSIYRIILASKLILEILTL